MTSNNSSERAAFDLAADVPTTAEDVAALRRARLDVANWLTLSSDDFERLVPQDALDRIPTTSIHAKPFELP